MRYAQGGGLTAEGRKRREQVRLEAARRFEQGAPAAVIAAELRVSERSVRRWRQAWQAAGPAGLASPGQAGQGRPDEGQPAPLGPALEAGPPAAGGGDLRGPPGPGAWGRRGIAPVVRVRGSGPGHVSVAGLACYRPGDRSRLIYRLHCYRGRKGETKAFTWTEYRDLLIAAHRQLPGGVVVLVRDNLNVHRRAELRAFTDAQAWLRVFRLPAYAPDLNPVEGIWSVLKGGVLANLAVASFGRSEEHTSELQSRLHLVCRLLLEKKKPRPRLSTMGLNLYVCPTMIHPTRKTTPIATIQNVDVRMPVQTFSTEGEDSTRSITSAHV